MKEKIIYFYSVFYYITWRWNVKCEISLDKAMDFILRKFICKLCTDKCKNRLIKNSTDWIEGREYLLKYPEKELKSVPHHRTLIIAPLFYMLIPMPPLLALDIAYIKFKYPVVIPAIIASVLYLIISIYTDKILETDNRLSKNAKKFGKKDKEWHKKWNWITIIYSINSIFLFILSFKLSLLIIDSAR